MTNVPRVPQDDIREAVHARGKGPMGTLYFPLGLVVNPKLL